MIRRSIAWRLEAQRDEWKAVALAQAQTLEELRRKLRIETAVLHDQRDQTCRAAEQRDRLQARVDNLQIVRDEALRRERTLGDGNVYLAAQLKDAQIVIKTLRGALERATRALSDRDMKAAPSRGGIGDV
jgi:hypothetical protein